MSRSNTKWITLAVVAAAGFGGYRLISSCGEAQDGLKHLANQVWIERLPENDRDQIHHLVLIQEGRDRFGAFGRSSTWRHFVEVFMWQREEDRLTLHLPQDRVRLDLTARVWNCEDEAPEPFELCLEISVQDRKRVYYSRRDWVIDPHDVDGSIADLAEANPELAPVLQEMGDDMIPTELELEVESADEWPEDAADPTLLTE
jgi:hypothetical protein